jgi:hypothetical protein
MSTNDKRNLNDQEIDLSVVSEKIGLFFQGVKGLIFNSIQFIFKHIIILGILFFLGLGLGIYFDKTQKIYDHEVIVQPNFGSTDYLYSKVKLLSSKIEERDTLFLKAIGIKEPSSLIKIKIEPVIDIYRFITSGNKDRNEQNFELLKLIAEDGDMKKIMKEKETSKNYSFHAISVTTNKLSNRKDVIEPLLAYLNNSSYFNEIKRVYMKNAQDKIIRNNQIIAQIDGFLSNYTQADSSTKSDKLVYYNENTQLNDVIQTKNQLISEIGGLQLDLVNINKVVKESSTTLNVKNTESLSSKKKMILPILFVFLYLLLYFFVSFYKKQVLKNKLS